MSRVPAYRSLSYTNTEPVTCPAWMVQTATAMRRLLLSLEEEFFVSPRDIMSTTVTKDIAEARHVAYWAVRNATNLSYGSIANRFNRFDHTVIKHGCERIEVKRWKEPAFRVKTDAILAGFKQSRMAA
jgi:chromosomal replication initiation ATPase DnaA